MKYYYTDIIQAAYMAKEYKIKIYALSGKRVENFTFWHSIITDVVDLGFMNDNWLRDKYYINEENYDIFQLQIGDMVRICGGQHNQDVDYIKHIDKNDIYLKGDGYGYLSFDDELPERERFSRFEILQRNNKPFFNPETSIDSHLPKQNINDFLRDK